MTDLDRAQRIRRRLAETIAWCAARPCTGDARGDLRTPDLLSPNLLSGSPGGRPSILDALLHAPHRIRAVVRAVVEERSRRLGSGGWVPDGNPVDLAGGRLLLAAPHESIPDGISEIESAGFFDFDDVPPWDTWVDFLEGEVVYTEECVRERQLAERARCPWTYHERYILAWVPPRFLSLVNAGIEINAYGCILWAVDNQSDTHSVPEFMRELEAAGLLT